MNDRIGWERSETNRLLSNLFCQFLRLNNITIFNPHHQQLECKEIWKDRFKRTLSSSIVFTASSFFCCCCWGCSFVSSTPRIFRLFTVLAIQQSFFILIISIRILCFHPACRAGRHAPHGRTERCLPSKHVRLSTNGQFTAMVVMLITITLKCSLISMQSPSWGSIFKLINVANNRDKKESIDLFQDNHYKDKSN